MSSDEKWLDLGLVEDSTLDYDTSIAGLFDEFMQNSPYGQEHRKHQEGSFSFQLAQRTFREFMDVLFLREAVHADIKRLFKPLPHVD